VLFSHKPSLIRDGPRNLIHEGQMSTGPSTAQDFPTRFIFVMTMLTASCSYGIRDIGSVPDNPTFNGDVYPLYADHCLICHGSPPDRGAPSYFRLDVYGDSDAVAGAQSMAAAAVADVQSGKMPPASRDGDGVGPNGLQLLQRWVQLGAPQ
jgi:hypothetical protein